MAERRDGPAAVMVYVVKQIAGAWYRATRKTGINYAVWRDWRYGLATPTLKTVARIYAAYPSNWDELDAALLASVRMFVKELADG